MSQVVNLLVAEQEKTRKIFGAVIKVLNDSTFISIFSKKSLGGLLRDE